MEIKKFESGIASVKLDSSDESDFLKMVKQLQRINGAYYVPYLKSWMVPINKKFMELFKDHVNEEIIKEFNELENISNYSESIEGESVQSDLRVNPFPFQYVPVHYDRMIKERFSTKGILVADEQGLGKTVEALLLTESYEKVVIVCPASLIGNWKKEIREKSDLDRFIICSYNKVGKLEVPEKFALIVDECHYIKNKTSIRSKGVMDLAEKAERVFMLTGTPILNRPVELWSILKTIDPDFMDFFSYAKRYCGAKRINIGPRKVWDFKGHSNLDELHDILKQKYMVRRVKKDVLKQLPDKTRVTVPIDDDVAYKKFEKVLEGVDNLFDALSANALIKSESKLLLEYISDLSENNDKIVVFYHHKLLGDVLENMFDCVRIDGSVNSDDRVELIDRFQNGNVRMALLSIGAASTGFTLTAADTMVFTEIPLVPGVLLQAEDRIHRIGQKNACTIFYPVVTRLDEHIQKLLMNKIAIVKRVMEGSNEDEKEIIAIIKEEFGFK
jgi:SWI/SNF-related matrix-associated actin-dependent regulator 1 of chromatin subfamily A